MVDPGSNPVRGISERVRITQTEFTTDVLTICLLTSVSPSEFSTR